MVICTSGGGQKAAFSVLMCSALPSLHMVDIDGSQCFPMFLYETEDGQ
ncbi:type ISP restriction/modification enzyme [Gluconacetobacter johannae]